MSWFAIKHEFFDALRFVRLRDRLRCPKCTAVGTWKPHGGRWDNADQRRVRRWMCKYCGHYEGPEGVKQVRPSAKNMCWEFEGPDVTDQTPQEQVSPVWPWRG